MIKFFRKIRKKLLAEGKTANYVKYAIGEIVLVVIGILIALTVAEWNNARHDNKTEIRLLNELHKGISEDFDSINKRLESTNKCILKLIELDSLLKLDVPVANEHLYELFGNVYGLRYLNLNKAIYEDLKSTGFGIIKDDKLRSQIIKVFEDNYKYIDGFKQIEFLVNQVNRPYYLTNFVELKFQKYAKPKDFQTLWKDTYYKNIVNYRLTTLQINQQAYYPKTIHELKILLKLIEQYLK
ncbi:DUF6090 family protein [Yeosuana sp. MJ-SS3]|uniref:DUF6090 family protein n=1 Tax=Gilvirhabdus luticola TaxID=3079858 RepID=A0ABU3U4C5_9FLAO|nr:DUF6090 family protein [Yeosuana sp. MJ-SS3]MDU8885256.1 DUF6090 family protein [Yeosuana sp. MJ-SS3]